MTNLRRALASSVGTKVVIALSGLVLFLFLVAHLLGNLTIFLGPETFNAYSHQLVTNPLVVPAELALLAVFLVHVWKTARMTLESRRARPVPYLRPSSRGRPSRKSAASSTMIWTGLVTLVFVALHLKTFKFGPWYEAGSGVRDLARLELEVFSSPGYVAFYVLAMLLLGFHLRHGFSSAFQSLGADHPALTPRLLLLGKALAVLLAAGFALIPLWVYFSGARP